MDEDRADFVEWYTELHPRLLASLVLVSGDPDLAREVVDEALARALARWDRVGTMSSPSGWTYRVALNLLRRIHRRAALERLALQRSMPATSLPGPAGEAWEVVKGLPRRQRTAVVLRYVGDLSEAEVAEVMGIGRSTASTTLTAARRSLAVLLGDPTPLEAT